MSELSIRECVSEADLRAAWPVMGQLRDHLDEAEYLRRVAAQRPAGFRVYVGETEGRIVAAMGLRPQTNLVYGFHLYVDDLVTDAAERSRGHGEAMIAYAESLARAWGASCLRLDSGKQRLRAHAFYERIGLPKSGFAFRKEL